MQEILENRMGIRGLVTVRRHPAGMIDRIKELHARGQHDEAQELLKSGEVATRQKNLVVDSANCGIDLLIQWLVSGLNTSIAFPIGPQWGEIGTGTTAPTLADVALQTPTLREPLSYAVDTSFNEAQLQFFFPDASLANGTYYEFGTFVSVSSVIGAGQLFNRALFASPYVKSAGNDTTVECDLTIINS
jgi:hypothetical protein